MYTVGIDAGNFAVKVAHAGGLDSFRSILGEYRDRRLDSQHGADDMVFEYNGRRGFAGTLAEYESEFSGSIMGDSKAHEDAKLRILLALHRIDTPTNNFRLVVGQPISTHNANNKEAIREMLVGSHTVKVNGRLKFLNIHDVKVAAEGATAFWADPTDGLVRVVDIGSGTVNCATLIDGRYVDRDSFTLNFGANTTISTDVKAMARAIATQTSRKWKPGDVVRVAGGIAPKLTPALRDHYFDCGELQPQHNGKLVSPQFANAIAFYKVGVEVYGEAKEHQA